MSESMQPVPISGKDRKALIEIANTRMPFGKYKGAYLVDLPEPYVVWMAGKGFPSGKLGRYLATIHEIKIYGLEDLLRPLQRSPERKPVPVQSKLIAHSDDLFL